MKYCSYCGKQLEDDVTQCPYCGRIETTSMPTKTRVIPVPPPETLNEPKWASIFDFLSASGFEHSLPKLVLFLSTALCFLFLFLDWVNINLWLVSDSYAPAFFLLHISDFQELADEADITTWPLFIVFAVVLVIIYATALVFSLQKKSQAIKVGLVAHSVMLCYSGYFLLLEKAWKSNVYSSLSYLGLFVKGIFSLTNTVFMAFLVSALGVVLSIWLCRKSIE